jgi:hypothetical protein
MATNNNLIGLGIIGVILAGVCGYIAHISVNVETYPDVEIAAKAGLTPSLSMGPHGYMHQTGSLVPLITLPHRYPNRSGNNITALIHHGMSPLSKRAPSDSKWIECPPSNVMW